MSRLRCVAMGRAKYPPDARSLSHGLYVNKSDQYPNGAYQYPKGAYQFSGFRAVARPLSVSQVPPLGPLAVSKKPRRPSSANALPVLPALVAIPAATAIASCDL